MARQSSSDAVHPSAQELFWALAVASGKLPALPPKHDNLTN